MGKKTVSMVAGALALSMGMGTGAATADWDWGGDLRVRVTDLKDIPITGPAEVDQLFNRNRTRLWASYQFSEDVSFTGRLMNEFRFYDKGRGYTRDHDPLGEIVPDLLYVDINNLAEGRVDLRLGRQELIYGTGNILLNGTPRDGSRSLFYNAIKASVDLGPAHSVDLLAIYNEAKDSLTINREPQLTLIEHDEAAAGVYGRYAGVENTPLEYYWIYKQEKNRSYARLGTRADADFHTVGVRAAPDRGQWAANLELALQRGSQEDDDLKGELLDASVTFRPDIWGDTRPAFTAGYYYLSGNDAGTDNNEGWRPVFSRWPQFSELYAYGFIGSEFGVAGWSNLKAPFVGLDMKPSPRTSLKLRYHRMYADEKDGPGNGDLRGDLLTAVLGVNLAENVRGHLWAEFLDPGDYHERGAGDAHFLRANIEYSF